MSAKGDHSEFIAFGRRIMRALSKRIGSADPEDLAEMLALSRELDECITASVAGLRSSGYSWAEIARATGTTRQAAFARWASKLT
ncbi:MAG TPA: hypothetical protein PKA99_13665 [Dermatophilaceae bacterium]|nr:hypothetical protein [Dermatophilaceae bacterium]